MQGQTRTYSDAEFHGKVRMARLRSDIIGYGPQPEPTEEAEQRLTITISGQVWLSRYNYGNGIRYSLKEIHRLRCDATIVSTLLEAMGRYFADNPTVGMATDVGMWSLELMNQDGERFKYHGSLVMDQSGLSDLLRHSLALPDLWAFDGGKRET